MLDVGTGVGALAVAYAELLPELTVVGLDVLPRVLTLAAGPSRPARRRSRRPAGAGRRHRWTSRTAYALAWLPAPFVPEAPLRAGVEAISRALVPGGWLVIGHGKFAGDPLDAAITRFKTVAYGGTPLDDDEAGRLLRGAGLTDVRHVPTPPGAPGAHRQRRRPE